MTEPTHTSTSPRGLPEAQPPSGPLPDQDATLAATPGQKPSGEVDVLARGEALGRYVVLSRLGAGGMGVVYAAYDPQLDRKVAVKLLLSHRTGETARARLLREAQALARLAHPNVVAVHDVGMHGERVFVAMEFVEGTTLGQWRQAKPRRWAAVLDTLVAAGRGLNAAHKTGLVHRDFKPDNVMVGTDGRVRVMDFGVAVVSTDSSADLDDPEMFRSGETDVSHVLTKAGAILGTPAYLAAERWGGHPATSASDQFSYCATLWECLYDSRPFVAQNMGELSQAIRDGQLTEPTSGARVPRWLRRIVQRGLEPDPQARWEDMSALLEALHKGRRSASNRPLRIAIGVAAIGSVAALATEAASEARRRRACEADAAVLGPSWDGAAKVSVREAFGQVPGDYGPQGAERTISTMDAWAERWAQARRTSCLDLAVELRTRADACLDVRRNRFAVLADVLQNAGPGLVVEAHRMSTELRPPEVCADPQYLAGLTPLTDAEFEALHAVRLIIADMRRVQLAGPPADAIALGKRAVASADASGLPQAQLEALLELGSTQTEAGTYDDAGDTYLRAYKLAGQADSPEHVARAAHGLATLLGLEVGRLQEARVWAHVTEVALARVHDPDGFFENNRLNTLAAIEIESGNYGEGLRLLQHLIELQSQGEDHRIPLGRSYANLGYLFNQTGEYAKAIAALERAEEAITNTFGPDFPMLSTVLNNLANAHWSAGDSEHALAVSRRAVALARASRGARHPDVAIAETTLGSILLDAEIEEDPIPLLRRSLAVFEESLGPKHPNVAVAVATLGVAHEFRGDLQRALPLYERALKMRLGFPSPDAAEVAATRTRLGIVLAGTGDLERARALLEQSLPALESLDDVGDLAAGLEGMSLVSRLDGDLDAALPFAERAWALQEVPDRQHALAGIELAEVLKARGDQARARALVDDLLAQQPNRPTLVRRRLEAWKQR